MTNVLEMRSVTKRYGATVALDAVTTVVPRGSIVGLIGRNGSGKSTLLRHAVGLSVADEGDCLTLGVGSPDLGSAELARIGLVQQHATLLEWMRTTQLLGYVAKFYPRWDDALERYLVEALEIDRRAVVGTLSPGNRQRLALVMAVCHHPELLLLDEPLSDLDPLARGEVLGLLLDRFRGDDVTIVISSHMLRDIEPVVSRILCLERGRVTADAELDDLLERHAEWIVATPAGRLPERFEERYVLSATGDARRARLVVRDAGAAAAAEFTARYDATIERRALNLEQLFPLLVAGPAGAKAAPAAALTGGTR
jgi:ABC-2 type transport system ATP-binding protein